MEGNCTVHTHSAHPFKDDGVFRVKSFVGKDQQLPDIQGL
jgi:hypothetical protein